ncbi:hypothetical protein OS965_02455 [Streptomyces sp. H27-G5]|uniref:hypothetical protein n=1 Tax=Streptomyces sp. H27-G5 TaxID=2996698 RepID=UPI00226DFA54|nr:hypothetical protein [Streptomyces sp. H27-G5]MCY0917038.1 hypothetical protein [Streptomyces sp. H27-G5]
MIEPKQVYRAIRPNRAGATIRIKVVGTPITIPGVWGYGKVDVVTLTLDGREVRRRAIEASRLHPLPVGTRVTHINQQWANAHTTPEGTAVIVEARGPYNDGSYEYRVLACHDFSRQPGPDNPLDRETWWSSLAVTPVTPSA